MSTRNISPPGETEDLNLVEYDVGTGTVYVVGNGATAWERDPGGIWSELDCPPSDGSVPNFFYVQGPPGDVMIGGEDAVFVYDGTDCDPIFETPGGRQYLHPRATHRH